jgi:hypothetical protein
LHMDVLVSETNAHARPFLRSMNLLPDAPTPEFGEFVFLLGSHFLCSRIWP